MRDKIIVVTGGRDYDDKEAVARNLEPLAVQNNILIAGGARGADELARRYWHYEAQLPYIVVPAQWDKYGRQAGHLRNAWMMDGDAIWPHATLVPDFIVPFPGGRGTASARKLADERGIFTFTLES